MKEHPIIFSGETVRAILDGRKTQTRRVAKIEGIDEKGLPFRYHMPGLKLMPYFVICPYGQPGDRLWVRENIRWHKEGTPTRYGADGCPVMRDGESVAWIFNEGHMPSIHMPRWASRITLEITDVRAERLQEINSETHDDVLKEGWPFEEEGKTDENPVWLFRRYWDSLNVKRGFGWDTNPFVWVISFKRIEQGRKS